MLFEPVLYVDFICAITRECSDQLKFVTKSFLSFLSRSQLLASHGAQKMINLLPIQRRKESLDSSSGTRRTKCSSQRFLPLSPERLSPGRIHGKAPHLYLAQP